MSAQSTVPAHAAWASLEREFPTISFTFAAADAGTRPTVDSAAWLDRRTPFDVFDEAVAALVADGGDTLVISGDDGELPRLAGEMLTRWQRWIDRRNAASSSAAFDRLLVAHRALHDVAKPLVKADYDHALDAWQWVLRIEPGASLAVQAAALLHDVERLESEADARIEQHAPDYQRFKDDHARRGAAIARAVVRGTGIGDDVADQVAELVSGHEHPGVRGDARLLCDADALSYFSLNSPGYLRYFGAAQTRRKVAYTLSRLHPTEHERLASMRLVADVAQILSSVVLATDRATSHAASAAPRAAEVRT